MITVKGTKTEAQQSDAADLYVLKSETQKSRTPYLIGALFSAVVLFLKSSISPKAAQDKSEHAGGVPPENKGTLVVEEVFTPPQIEPGARDAAESEIETGSSFRFSAAMPQSMFQGRLGNEKMRVSGFDGNVARPANLVNKPSAPKDAFDIKSMMGSSEDLAHAWPREDAADSEAVVDDADERNRAPRSGRPTYLRDVTSGTLVLIALSDLLANISDQDNDVLTVMDASVSSGTLTKTDDGYLFRADPAALGPVQLSFKVSDGQASIIEVAHFSIVPNDITGTDQGDMLAGTAFIDEIHGLDGNDNIDALGGNDHIFGGAGNDNLSGGQGNDVIFGGAGDDNILGGAGNDLISGGDGDDNIFGDEGDDVLYGDAGQDVLSDGTGADIVFGGMGDDRVMVALDDDDDYFDGGDGEDTLDYSQATSDLKIDLTTNIATGNGLGSDIIVSFEIVKGGEGDDHFIIGADEVTLFGGGGANMFEFINVAHAGAPALVSHQINDFKLGDTIKTNKYLIYEKSDDDDGDDLNSVMTGSPTTDDDSGHIRYRYEKYDDSDEKTIVEWDDEDTLQLTAVTLNGHFVMVWSEHA